MEDLLSPMRDIDLEAYYTNVCDKNSSCMLDCCSCSLLCLPGLACPGSGMIFQREDAPINDTVHTGSSSRTAICCWKRYS